MTRAEVQPGVCGFEVVVTATSTDMRHVRLHLESPCPAVSHLAALVGEVDAFCELEPDNAGGVIWRMAISNLYCGGCPVPAAMVKAVEVETGLAQPRDVTIRLEQEADE